MTRAREPHRLPLDEMEYTTMPKMMKKLKGRWKIVRGESR